MRKKVKSKLSKASRKRAILFDKALKEDKAYFKTQVEKGIKRLAGEKTRERVNNCYHCKLWNKSDKFIKEVLEL